MSPLKRPGKSWRQWWPVAAAFAGTCAARAYRWCVPDKRTEGQIRQAEKERQKGIRRELRDLPKEPAKHPQ